MSGVSSYIGDFREMKPKEDVLAERFLSRGNNFIRLACLAKTIRGAMHSANQSNMITYNY